MAGLSASLSGGGGTSAGAPATSGTGDFSVTIGRKTTWKTVIIIIVVVVAIALGGWLLFGGKKKKEN